MLKGRLSKLMVSILAVSFLTLNCVGYSARALSEKDNNDLIKSEINGVSKSGEQSNYYRNGGPIDTAVANEFKIIEMLKKEGKISKEATFEEEQEAYTEYMQSVAKNNNNQKVTKESKELNGKAKENKNRDGVSTYEINDETTNINVLAVMVEYNDYKHNSIQLGETEMYYESYDRQHYQDMLFGEDGYKGPNGEDLISMTQFYEEQSGGTMKITGTVTDWYTAPKNAAYYGEHVGGSNDVRPRNLIAHALNEVGKDESIDLADFDKIDRYDLDGDGDYNEPDGMIDYLIVIHAGVGEEAGGGSLGSNAIWSHSWDLGGLYPIPGTSYTEEDGTTRPYYAYKYTTEPEDGAAGVFAHEFGHELGLPDEYDTQYSSASSEPISNWSIMSSGSWAGVIPGTEPTGISPYGREMLQSIYGGNFQKQTVINYEDLTTKGTSFDINSASKTGQVVRINLPQREYIINTPTSGEYSYWGGKGVDEEPVKNSMTTIVDLTEAVNPSLQFKTWYDIEYGWDFASIQVRESGTEDWSVIEGNITTTDHDPDASVVVPYGITGTSDGWIDGVFDLTDFAGKNIELKFEYETDLYTFGQGFYVDDINIVDGENAIFSDDAEQDGAFTLEGFVQDTGKVYADNYYLIEWRDHQGVDSALAHISSLGNVFAYDPGMVVWYVNNHYTDNWGEYHPGGGYLSVVDADQNNINWVFGDKSTMATSNKYQMHDAAFSSKNGSKFVVDFSEIYGRNAIDKYSTANPKFTDKKEFNNTGIPTLGTDLPKLGLDIQILKQLKDNSGATIRLSVK